MLQAVSPGGAVGLEDGFLETNHRLGLFRV